MGVSPTPGAKEECSADAALLSTEATESARDPPRLDRPPPLSAERILFLGSPADDQIRISVVNVAEELGFAVYLLTSRPIRVKMYLSRGAYGAVYSCKYQERVLAVKRIDLSGLSKPARVSSLVRSELQVIGKVDVLSSICHLPHVFFRETTLELLSPLGGRSLQWILDHRVFVNRTAVAVNVLHAALECLTSAAAQQLCHRDVKPANIVQELGNESRYLVIDWGFAVRAGAVDQICGTVAFMSPESLSRPAATTASDVWGLGMVVLYILDPKFSVRRLVADHMSHKEFLRSISRDSPGSSERRSKVAAVLEAKFAELENANAHWFIGPVVLALRRMLVLQPEDRWTASQVLHMFKRAHRKYLQVAHAERLRGSVLTCNPEAFLCF
ncbi:MAG: uncharacterized protein KVP18_002864 [Porospora cf. gigantea A]|uniref:uncharacterized protein n=1 Tax=Porospora cf. gigantea A TaxID=2853593 RepID=UPI00355A2E95|nr:MAG: hypothetical protein KVP18_002864 [Porospora cf. gigantea A]